MKKAFIGLTVLALAAMVAVPALAHRPGGDRGSDITVINIKTADVFNGVLVVADTGGNTANGDKGGNGGEAGSANWNDNDGGNQTNTGGKGGNGGAGGSGGSIVTGGATAFAQVDNMVNTNNTYINACACPPAPCPDGAVCETVDGCYDPCPCPDDIKVVNVDKVDDLDNMVGVFAKTGDNEVDGDKGGHGGLGGDANGNMNDDCGGCRRGNQDNDGGTGGTGAAGGDGGTIRTGASYADAWIINILNSVTTRILR